MPEVGLKTQKPASFVVTDGEAAQESILRVEILKDMK